MSNNEIEGREMTFEERGAAGEKILVPGYETYFVVVFKEPGVTEGMRYTRQGVDMHLVGAIANLAGAMSKVELQQWHVGILTALQKRATQSGILKPGGAGLPRNLKG